MSMAQQSVPLSRLPGGGTAGQSSVMSSPSTASASGKERNLRAHTDSVSMRALVRLLAGSKPCFRFTQTACPAGLKAAHEVRHAAA